MQVAAGCGYTVFVTADRLVYTYACGLNDEGSRASWVLATEKTGWCQRWLQGSCKPKQPCTLQQAVATHSASQQMVRYLLGAAMTGVSWVFGTHRTGTCQRWLQGCRPNEWCMSQLATITQSAAQQAAVCSLWVMATMGSWALGFGVLAMTRPSVSAADTGER